MLQTFFSFFFLTSDCLAIVIVQTPSFFSVQGCISEGSKSNGAYSFAAYKTWGTEVKVLSARGAQRIRQRVPDYSTAAIYG